MKFFANKKRGFTLPEVLIGIAVLAVALVTATSLFVGITRGNKVNMNDLTAYYLAAEGVEAARNIRDTHWFNNIQWTGDAAFKFWGTETVDFAKKSKYIVSRNISTNLASVVQGEGGASFNNDQKIASIKQSAPWLLSSVGDGELKSSKTKLMMSGKRYLHQAHNGGFGGGSSLQVSAFSRYLEIEPVDDQDKTIKVKSVVFWEENDGPREVVLETILTDWKSGPK